MIDAIADMIVKTQEKTRGAAMRFIRSADPSEMTAFAFSGAVVIGAVAVAFSAAGTGLATQTVCQPFVQAAPEVIRPVAQDTWFLPPMTLEGGLEDERKEPEQASTTDQQDEYPARKYEHRRHRRRG